MANVVVTSTTNSIKVDFGDYASSVGMAKGTWNKGNISSFKLASGDTYVSAHTLEEIRWTLVYAASGANLIVDSVDGASPSSNSDLYDKLIALIA